MEKPPNMSEDVVLRSASNIVLEALEHKELRNEIEDFAVRLEKKYPDVRSRVLWNLLVGNSLEPGENATMEDYPGEDSVLNFVKRLAIENEVRAKKAA